MIVANVVYTTHVGSACHCCQLRLSLIAAHRLYSICTLALFVQAGASEGILVWYGQPSEVQFTRGGGGGGVAELNILEI